MARERLFPGSMYTGKLLILLIIEFKAVYFLKKRALV